MYLFGSIPICLLLMYSQGWSSAAKAAATSRTMTPVGRTDRRGMNSHRWLAAPLSYWLSLGAPQAAAGTETGAGPVLSSANGPEQSRSGSRRQGGTAVVGSVRRPSSGRTGMSETRRLRTLPSVRGSEQLRSEAALRPVTQGTLKRKILRPPLRVWVGPASQRRCDFDGASCFAPR